MTGRLSTIEEALAALRRGLPVLVTDDEDRENEGDVILAAEAVTEQWLGWTVRHTSGVVCAPMPDAIADRLQLPPMVSRNEDPRGTAYTISVDAREGVSTGISAADRARTLRLLADPATDATDLLRPGHVFPLRARAGGVLSRAGHTEAAVDLCRLAGLAPVGVIAELVHDDGTMMRLPDVLELGAGHGLPVVTIEQLIAWRQRHDRVERIAETRLPTEHGVFRVVGYRDLVTEDEHVALVSPRGLDGRVPLARLHSECLTGDVFSSQRCDCGPQLERAMERVGAEGGVVVYLRGHEGRGVGLLHKLRAYALQDEGFDTVDAQIELGLPIDAREYAAGAAILADLGVRAVRLLTNNPLKVSAMREHDIEVAAVERLSVAPGADNAGYLRTKRDRMGHDLVIEAADTGATA
jgi:3,4-dihydroxy 2-butanone 4-phosphate synthase / GTP cyclohydrolase II